MESGWGKDMLRLERHAPDRRVISDAAMWRKPV